ncbi:hypothetical protein HPP92_010695 [Vanilla planifolia]|uniref:Uncharacterized protein n=1 Tax=Vanilla planifolia TaxID=51239 RepID=A0A835R482_VANPL|nr:hypothetical protein HPP92_010695 [Vanilla planifolia]
MKVQHGKCTEDSKVQYSKYMKDSTWLLLSLHKKNLSPKGSYPKEQKFCINEALENSLK